MGQSESKLEENGQTNMQHEDDAAPSFSVSTTPQLQSVLRGEVLEATEESSAAEQVVEQVPNDIQ